MGKVGDVIGGEGGMSDVPFVCHSNACDLKIVFAIYVQVVGDLDPYFYLATVISDKRVSDLRHL